MKNIFKTLLTTGPLSPSLLAIARIAIGTTFLYHSMILWDSTGMHNFSVFWGDKFNIPFPLFSIYVAKVFQFLAAISMVLGILTRFGAILGASTMFVATFVAHKGTILNIPAIHYITSGEGETAFAYLLLFSCFILIGPGRFSLDYSLFHKNKG